MSSYVLSAIPLWAYITVFVLIAVVLLYFFGPLLAGVWRIMPNWLRIVLGAIVGVFGVFVYGRHKGYKDVKEEQKKLDERATENRKEIHDEVKRLDTSELDKRLDKWMRD